MSIRSTAKAIIINNGKVLLNVCQDDDKSKYYALPGGGQNQYETLYDAVVRECLEETGYLVVPLRLAAVCEEIFLSEEIRQSYPHAHKVYHIFLCELSTDEQKTPTEQDSSQLGCEWIDIANLKDIRLLPNIVSQNILGVMSGDVPVFLGSEQVDYNRGRENL